MLSVQTRPNKYFVLYIQPLLSSTHNECIANLCTESILLRTSTLANVMQLDALCGSSPVTLRKVLFI